MMSLARLRRPFPSPPRRLSPPSRFRSPSTAACRKTCRCDSTTVCDSGACRTTRRRPDDCQYSCSVTSIVTCRLRTERLADGTEELYHNTGLRMGQTRRRQPAQDPFWDLVATAKRLQAPGGCAWDRAQTTTSLLPHLIEETWEVFEAAQRGRRQAFLDELGDVLYTVLFLALIAQRQGWGTLRAMLTRTRRKMIRRHPHVFGTSTARTPEEAIQSWRKVKQAEGAPASRGKALRPLLVDSWDLLHRQPGVTQAFERMVRRLERSQRRTSGPRVRRRARPSRTTARSPSQAPSPLRGNRTRETRQPPRRPLTDT